MTACRTLAEFQRRAATLSLADQAEVRRLWRAMRLADAIAYVEARAVDPHAAQQEAA